MDSGLLKTFRLIQSHKTLRLNKKLLVFLLFLVISSFLWFLNKLSSEYTTFLSFPVKYKNIPKDMVLVGEPQNQIKLKINAYGYTLFRYELSTAIAPVAFDINSLYQKRMTQKENNEFYIVTYYAKEKIAEQLQSDVKILEIYPDTIFFKLTPKSKKKVPIKANLNLTFQKQYLQYGSVGIFPDSVVASGPKSIIDTLSVIQTQTIEANNVNRNFRHKTMLDTITDVTYSENKVFVSVNVEKYTEQNYTIPIQLSNHQENENIRFLPDKINVKFMVAMRDFEMVKPYHFSAVADFNTRTKFNNKLKVTLEKQPLNIQSLIYFPKTVDYIIEK